jgi:hypothetical protein
MNLIPLIYAILISTIIILIFFAIKWEYTGEYQMSLALPAINEIPSDDQKQRAHIFYGCYILQNRVIWKSVFTISVLLVITLWIIFYIFNIFKLKDKKDITIAVGILLIFAIFLPFFFYENFMAFHLYRPLCERINPSLTVKDKFG